MRLSCDRRHACPPAACSLAPPLPGTAPRCAPPGPLRSWRRQRQRAGPGPGPGRLALLGGGRDAGVRVRATDLTELLARTGPMLPGLLTATTAVSNALWRRASRQGLAQELCRAFNVGSTEELQVRRGRGRGAGGPMRRRPPALLSSPQLACTARNRPQPSCPRAPLRPAPFHRPSPALPGHPSQ
jgi:hypothetical protein